LRGKKQAEITLQKKFVKRTIKWEKKKKKKIWKIFHKADRKGEIGASGGEGRLMGGNWRKEIRYWGKKNLRGKNTREKEVTRGSQTKEGL